MVATMERKPPVTYGETGVQFYSCPDSRGGPNCTDRAARLIKTILALTWLQTVLPAVRWDSGGTREDLETLRCMVLYARQFGGRVLSLQDGRATQLHWSENENDVMPDCGIETGKFVYVQT